MKILSRSFILPLLTFCGAIVIWELTICFSGWKTQVFPDPLTVVTSIGQLIANGTLVKHTIASLFRVTAGFYLAIFLGIPLGMVLGRNTFLLCALNPLIQFMRPISPLAWIPIAMLWFGIGEPPAVFLIFLSSFFPLVVSTTLAVSSINPTYFQVAANFNLTRWEVISKIIVPAMLPEVITALRITLGIAWLVVVAAEMIAVDSGLGYLILDSRNALRMDYVMAGMVVIGLIGLALDMAMKKLGKAEAVAWGTFSQ
ncbi:ABC transporter permease [Desulfobulbus rhabdoformis]|uniref:ABC transporter permease n=1 Tax=Desulfobulbus rhabdoformis TaxID=34032 RepID=UPI001F05DFEC|nr:ABC transporter permease [Desulfobulbus rhabdoformis]